MPLVQQALANGPAFSECTRRLPGFSRPYLCCLCPVRAHSNLSLGSLNTSGSQEKAHWSACLPTKWLILGVRYRTLLIKQRGALEAEIEAAQRADELLEAGDMDGRGVWLSVVEAVKELSEAGLPPDGTVH